MFCRFSLYVVRHLHQWKDELECGDDIDLVHWNAGLWDDLRMLDGEPLTDIDSYKANIERNLVTYSLRIFFKIPFV